jgi:hypothetical protein
MSWEPKNEQKNLFISSRINTFKHQITQYMTFLLKSSPFNNLLLLWVALLTTLRMNATTNVYIKNYTKQEYNAASQNWSCAQDGTGNMFFANNIGLLEFDGNSWVLYPAHEGSNIRAVAVDGKNRVYTAGYRELGYWDRNKYGKLEYHSTKKRSRTRVYRQRRILDRYSDSASHLFPFVFENCDL